MPIAVPLNPVSLRQVRRLTYEPTERIFKIYAQRATDNYEVEVDFGAIAKVFFSLDCHEGVEHAQSFVEFLSAAGGLKFERSKEGMYKIEWLRRG